MMNKQTVVLYHKEVRIPPELRTRAAFKGTLKYGRHATQEASLDRYGNIALPSSFDSDSADLIEVEWDKLKRQVTKCVWRQALDPDRDLVLVVIPDTGFVKTVWINLKTDKHRTLDRSKYTKKFEV
jgi:hypothetical protein